ncbi:MAG: nucleotidyltransferase domain-containing protein [Candidatus Pacearchaeota archaeon]
MKTEIIKQAIKIGNSSGVILPKAWENRKVKVELVEDSINKDILEIINEKGLLSEVVGIYLVGSYARSEETPESDIDILIVTENTNKNIVRGNYEILIISKKNLEKNLKKNLYLYSMVNEAKPILNKSLLKKYKEINHNLPEKKIINEIKSVLNINKETAKISQEHGKPVLDGTAYSVILRIKELFILYCIIKKKKYSKREFLKTLLEKNAEESYNAYLRVKNDSKNKNNINPEEIISLIEFSENLIKKIIGNGKKK